MPEPKVVVVGAGVGGLVAALELASRGVEVLVLERAAQAGGKLRELTVCGKAIDAGPTVFTMRDVFEEVFATAGSSLSQEVTLNPLEILARHAWSSTERLDLFADLERTADAIGAFAGPDEARRYRRFCDQAEQVYETLASTFIRASRPNPLTLVKRVAAQNVGNLTRIKPFASLWRALGQQLRDPRLQQLFGRYATYMGSSPFSAPATLMLIAHVERTGVWSVDGGMYRLVEALCRVARQQGVSFRFASEVQEVFTDQGRVTGLALKDGERLDANTVIINADAAAVSAGLFGPAISRCVPAAPPSRRSLSALTWAMVARVEGFPLHRHTVFFSNDYAAEFNAIFRHSRLPQAPTVYVCAQDRGDSDAQPAPVPERLFCLVNAPPTGDIQQYESAEIEHCRQQAFALLRHCGLQVSFPEEASEMTGPEQFARLFPGTGGALYGPLSHGWMASFQRSGARTRQPGLYLAGGSTHPGAGVPMAALSGRQAALAVLQDLERRR